MVFAGKCIEIADRIACAERVSLIRQVMALNEHTYHVRTPGYDTLCGGWLPFIHDV